MSRSLSVCCVCVWVWVLGVRIGEQQGWRLGTRRFFRSFFPLLFLSGKKRGEDQKEKWECRVIKQNRGDTGQMSLIGIRFTSKSSGWAVQVSA